MSFNFSEKDLLNEDVLCKKLLDLASIVYTRHFYANYKEKQDLISVAVLKALSLIQEGNWDKKKGSLLTFLYSGMRNEMHNYIYRISREILMDNEYIDTKVTHEIEAEDVSFLNVKYEIISNVCSKFPFYGDMSKAVSQNLERIGFKVTGIVYDESNNGGDSSNKGNSFENCTEFYTDLVERLSGAVLWKNREYYL